MNTHKFFTRAGLGLLFFLGAVSQLCADITVRLSVKFILRPDGTRPTAGRVGTATGFDAEVARGNRVLAATGRGFKLHVTYDDIQPSAPANQSAGYWFDLDARENRQTIENAAVSDQNTWKWSQTAINIYVNNSGSGQCSFPGTGGSISLGQNVSIGTVLHEIGHFFGLSHTHVGDPDCRTAQPPYSVADGDGLDSTILDHACLDTSPDELSQANFGGRTFSQLSADEQARVNSSWLNVMSYHQEDQLLDEQMDYVWAVTVNTFRQYVCNGRTWFVAPFGTDDIFLGGVLHGIHPLQPFRTISKAVSASSPDDVILIETSGAYSAPSGNVFNTPCTLRVSGGPVTIVRAP